MHHDYFDFAAATPVLPPVLRAMQPYYQEKFHNPSGLSVVSRHISQDILSARQTIAHWLGAKPTEVIFTAGGTEANNLAIHGIMSQHPEGSMVASSVEHEAVLAPASQYTSRLAPVDKDGLVKAADVIRAIDDTTVLVSIMYANNEIGTIQPLADIARHLQAIKKERVKKGVSAPLYFHTDACQAPNYLDIHVNALGVDLMTLNAGKIYGPKQTGCLYVQTGCSVKPLIQGGGQERGLRSGTENVANIIGFATALDYVQKTRKVETKRISEMQQYFIKRLQQQIPGVQINGSLDRRIANNVHITIPGTDNERLMMELEQHGIICAAGSACNAGNETPSHVLGAIGMTDTEAQSSLRFSLGRPTTKDNINRVLDSLSTIL